MANWGGCFFHLFALNNKKLHLAANIFSVLSSQNSPVVLAKLKMVNLRSAVVVSISWSKLV